MNTIIEKIRTWVERKLKNTHDWLNGKGAKKGSPRYYEMRGRESAFDSVLSILSDLEKEEKPMNPNEDVFKIWGTTKEEYLAKSMDNVHLEMEIATYLKDWEDDEEIGLHLSTDNGCIPIELDDVRDIARHFAQWQKEQMMRSAVEGEVCYGSEGAYIETDFLGEYNTSVYGNPGDKVKLIIVKED